MKKKKNKKVNRGTFTGGSRRGAYRDGITVDFASKERACSYFFDVDKNAYIIEVPVDALENHKGLTIKMV